MRYEANKISLASIKIFDGNDLSKKIKSTVIVDAPVITYKIEAYYYDSSIPSHYDFDGSRIVKIEKDSTYLELWFADPGYLWDFSIILHDKSGWIWDENIVLSPVVEGIPRFGFPNVPPTAKYVTLNVKSIVAYHNLSYIVFMFNSTPYDQCNWVNFDRFYFGYNTEQEFVGMAIWSSQEIEQL